MNMQITSNWSPADSSISQAAQAVCSFLDVAATSLGRATHYNTREQQAAAEAASHAALLELDRGLYAALLLVPGVSDRARQIGVRSLLSRPRPPDALVLLDAAGERAVVEALVAQLPAQRALKLFASLGAARVNNARTRKLILRTLLGSPRLELWSVKYRAKVREALVHAWGRKTASHLRELLSIPLGERTPAQRQTLDRLIGKYAKGQVRVARECVGFVLGAGLTPTLALLSAFEGAKVELARGARLPVEVLEGIRSTYHPQVDRKALLELARGAMTKTQRRQVQRTAARVKVEVAMDPRDYGAIELYIYAFEMGVSVEIAEALVARAKRAAASFPLRYGTVGVLVDASASMAGHASQKLRPMAVTLALRDMLQRVGDRQRTVYCGGEVQADEALAQTGFAGLVEPQGETSLAQGLLELLDHGAHEPAPEAVYVLSDGYENAPAGRFDEVVRALRGMGIAVPIYHLSPVFAAESRGVRSLAQGLTSMAVARPDALGLSFLRGLVETEPLRGIQALLRAALSTRALNTNSEVEP